jgi:dolichol-phosphate mannosyltransferase
VTKRIKHAVSDANAINSPQADGLPQVSIVVPVHNEEGAVGQLIEEIADAFAGRSYEMVFVNDRSRDKTLELLVGLKARFPALRVLDHGNNAGQSRAVRSGILAARGTYIGTLDGDGQNVPADLIAMIEQMTRADAPTRLALIGGRRVGRKDSQWKLFGSRVGNGIRQRLLGDDATDTGCGIKLFRRDVYTLLPFFDHQHRFLPALMAREGYLCEYRDVQHRARQTGQSKYTNFGRLKASVADVWGVMWLKSRARLPGDVREL